LYLTPLALLHGTGATGTFRFKKQGQTCKVKKNRGKRAVTAQNKGSFTIYPIFIVLVSYAIMNLLLHVHCRSI